MLHHAVEDCASASRRRDMTTKHAEELEAKWILDARGHGMSRMDMIKTLTDRLDITLKKAAEYSRRWMLYKL